MPFWSLYLEDQGFNYQEIGILSSIAIVTRFLRHLFGVDCRQIRETHVAGAYSYLDGSLYLVHDFYHSQ